MSRVLGVIVAGGKATRLGGADKALLHLAGEPLLAHVTRRFGAQVDGLILNANGDPARFQGFGLPVIADTVPGQPGPLGGVLAGLDQAARGGFERVLSVPVDVPGLPLDLRQRLDAGLDADARASVAVAASGGRRHGVTALWRVEIRDQLRAALVQEQLHKVGLFQDRIGAVAVAWDGPDPFLNINSPSDLADAERRLGESS